jgi:hypothetical protein
MGKHINIINANGNTFNPLNEWSKSNIYNNITGKCFNIFMFIRYPLQFIEEIERNDITLSYQGDNTSSRLN